MKPLVWGIYNINNHDLCICKENPPHPRRPPGALTKAFPPPLSSSLCTRTLPSLTALWGECLPEGGGSVWAGRGQSNSRSLKRLWRWRWEQCSQKWILIPQFPPCHNLRPRWWEESSSPSCLRSVRTGWQESEPPSAAKPDVAGPGPRCHCVGSCSGSPGTVWPRGMYHLICSMGLALKRLKGGPSPRLLDICPEINWANPLLGRIGWRVEYSGRVRRQAGIEEASVNEGAETCWSLWRKKRANFSAVHGQGWQVGRETAVLLFSPALPEGLCTPAVTTFDSTSCHSGREHSQHTLAFHSCL